MCIIEGYIIRCVTAVLGSGLVRPEIVSFKTYNLYIIIYILLMDLNLDTYIIWYLIVFLLMIADVNKIIIKMAGDSPDLRETRSPVLESRNMDESNSLSSSVPQSTNNPSNPPSIQSSTSNHTPTPVANTLLNSTSLSSGSSWTPTPSNITNRYLISLKLYWGILRYLSTPPPLILKIYSSWTKMAFSRFKFI